MIWLQLDFLIPLCHKFDIHISMMIVAINFDRIEFVWKFVGWNTIVSSYLHHSPWDEWRRMINKKRRKLLKYFKFKFPFRLFLVFLENLLISISIQIVALQEKVSKETILSSFWFEGLIHSSISVLLVKKAQQVNI